MLYDNGELAPDVEGSFANSAKAFDVYVSKQAAMIKKLVLILFSAFLVFICFPSLLSPVITAQGLTPINYDIVYVRSPRPGDNANTFWSDAVTPLLLDAGADLMLLHPDGSEEILFNAGANGAVMDPYVAYDARSVVFAYFPNVRNANEQRGVNSQHALSYDGADIYRVDLASRAVTRLTFQEFTPNTGNGADFDCSRSETNCPRVGVFNTGPACLPDGRIVFTSTRDNFIPNKMSHAGQRAMQLYVMDGDGKNVQPIGFLNVSSAMHPFVLKDGRIVFTSWENQGARDDRVFPLWAIWPDGTRFEPFSGFGDGPFAHHFMTQLSDGSIVVCRYYNLNNNGFGELYRFPINGTGIANDPLFQPIPPDSDSTDEIPLKRVGYTRITPFTSGDDFPAPCRVGDPVYPPVACPGGNNTRVGKFTMPSAAPNNEMLVVYTHGAANHNGIYVGAGLTAPYYDGGIYRMRGDQVLNRPENLVLVKNDPNYNEMWPRAVVPYQQIHGVAAPTTLPELANDGQRDSRLPEGTPLALIGTSSLISRDTRPFRGDRFYQHENFGDRNWTRQGADAGLYTDNDIYAIRVLALQPITDRSYPNNGRAFGSLFSERLRILGEIPVRKEGVIDAQGNVDTSFLAKIPADVPFTFQTLDRNGLVLNMAQTWHQVRPGEVRVDCGGCHAHSKPALDFRTTAASQNNYVVRDLALTTPLLAVDGSTAPGVTTANTHSTTVEYLRDIKPILQAKCASCHTSRNGQTPAAGLDLDADNRLVDGYPATYAWLARPRSESNPTPRSVSPEGDWYWPQVTRYIRAGQARQSLLVWKIFGRRLDGRTNADRPTESVAGNPATIPPGVEWSECDLDYTGTQMPPSASGVALTWEERMKIARWVDLGAPIDLTGIIQAQGGGGFAGYLEDDLRPTLSLVPSVQRAAATGNLSRFVIGAYDLESGLEPGTLVLTLNRAVGNMPAGTNLAAGLVINEGGTVTINLPAPIEMASGSITVTAQIRDRAGHLTRIVRTYQSTAVGNCNYAISPTAKKFKARGGTDSVSVTTEGGCVWQATSNVSWITITSGSNGTGNGTVIYSVAANAEGRKRKGRITVAGQTLLITQKGG
jgi:Hydrazine synthase alpha subunit middle domain/Viral BACON domain